MRRLTLRRIDWPRVIGDLTASGWKHHQIAYVMDHSRPWVSMLITGRFMEPKHRDGEALLLLWSQVMGRSSQEAPRHNPRETILTGTGSSIGATPISWSTEHGQPEPPATASPHAGCSGRGARG